MAADRSEASMAAFYAWLGRKKSGKIKLAMMDMWKRVLQRQLERRCKYAVKLRER